jgi:hypothetical protein
VAVYVGFTAKWADLIPSTLLLLIVLKATKWTVSAALNDVARQRAAARHPLSRICSRRLLALAAAERSEMLRDENRRLTRTDTCERAASFSKLSPVRFSSLPLIPSSSWSTLVSSSVVCSSWRSRSACGCSCVPPGRTTRRTMRSRRRGEDREHRTSTPCSGIVSRHDR